MNDSVEPENSAGRVRHKGARAEGAAGLDRGFVFSNLTLRGEKLEYLMRSPFDLMVGRADYAEWLGD